jgi:iron complex outermembrane receptor protein
MSVLARLVILLAAIALGSMSPPLATDAVAEETAADDAARDEEQPAESGPTAEQLEEVDPDFVDDPDDPDDPESRWDDNLEEIVVTSTKRAESIQDVPISVTALSSQMLEDRGLTNFQELGTFVPNLQILPVTDTRSTSIRIRGIGSEGSNAGIDPSVGVFIDGVYQGRAGMSVGDLLDIERVEVLRGPQGTLYGKNTAAGAISIVTRRPSYEREATTEVVFGNYRSAEVRGTVNIPIVEDRVATRLSGYYVTRDGWSINDFNGENVNNSDKWGARAKVAFDINDAFSIQISGDYAQQNPRSFVADIITYQGPTTFLNVSFQDMAMLPGRPAVPFADPFDQIVGANDRPINKVVVGGAAVDMLYDWDERSIRWLTAWRTYNTDSQFDGDFSIYDAVIQNTHVDLNQASSELTITSPASEKYQYQAGAYFFYSTMDTSDLLEVKGDWVAVQRVHGVFFYGESTANLNLNNHKTYSGAAYGEASWGIVENVLKLVGGLRVTHERKTRDGLSIGDNPVGNVIEAPPILGPTVLRLQERSVTNLQGKAVLQYYPFENTSVDFIDNFMLYFSFANGFKSGGFNQLRTGQILPSEFNDELSLNYEFGMKTNWFDRRVMANLTAFYTDYDDFQAQTFNGTSINVVNAGNLISYGLEGEFNYLPPIENLVLGAQFGWNITEYIEFKAAPNTIEAQAACQPAVGFDPKCGIQDLSGEVLSNAPRLTVSLFTQYEQEIPWKGIQWFMRADYTYTSRVFLSQDLDRNLLQPRTNLLNLRTGLRAEDDFWSLTLWMNNVVDERWLVAGFNVPVLNGYAGVMAPPRYYGITLRFKF